MRKNTYFYRLYPQYTRNMTEKESALYSHYIIDGVHLDTTPAEILEECTDAENYDYSDYDGGYFLIDTADIYYVEGGT